MENTDPKIDKMSPNRLVLLVTIVRRKKADFFADLIQAYGANAQFKVLAEGSAKSLALEYLGVDDEDKIAIFSLMKAPDAKKALADIEEKFGSVRNGKGISFIVPVSSIMGMQVFAFFSNQRDYIREEA